MSREKAISKIRLLLLAEGFPRLQMLLMVVATGGAGFLTSFLLLRQGVDVIWLRYLLAMTSAYLFFLFLLWVWLRRRPDPLGDALEVGEMAAHSGGGLPLSAPGGSLGKPLGASFDLGDAADSVEGALFLVIGLAVAIVFSSLWMVWTAPTLFAELLLDAALAAGLYRRLKKLPRRHWLETAIRGTIWPYVVTTLLVVAIGWAMSRYLPEARSLGDVVAALRAPSA